MRDKLRMTLYALAGGGGFFAIGGIFYHTVKPLIFYHT
jgi:hypothetical protein